MGIPVVESRGPSAGLSLACDVTLRITVRLDGTSTMAMQRHWSMQYGTSTTRRSSGTAATRSIRSRILILQSPAMGRALAATETESQRRQERGLLYPSITPGSFTTRRTALTWGTSTQVVPMH